MFRYCMVALVALVAIGPVVAQDDKVRAAIKSIDPNAKIDAIRPSAVPNLMEVTLGGQVIYVTNDGAHLIQGMLFDIAKRTDLTELRKADLRRGLMAKAPSGQRIVFKPKGEVKHTVAVYTDIDCGYCRELHKHMEEYNERGIQVEYLMFPRSGPGTDSFRKAVAAWCSKDQQGALTKAKNGVDPGNATCVNPIEAQWQLGQQMGVTGTPTIIFPDGNVAPGYVTPDQLEQRLTAAEAAVAAADAAR